MYQQEDRSSCRTRRHLLKHADMCSCSTRRHVFLLNKNTCLLEEDTSSCSTRIAVFLFDKRTDMKTCLPVQPEGCVCCWTKRHAFLLNERTRLLVKQEDMSSGSTGRHCLKRMQVFLFRKHIHNTTHQSAHIDKRMCLVLADRLEHTF